MFPFCFFSYISDSKIIRLFFLCSSFTYSILFLLGNVTFFYCYVFHSVYIQRHVDSPKSKITNILLLYYYLHLAVNAINPQFRSFDINMLFNDSYNEREREREIGQLHFMWNAWQKYGHFRTIKPPLYHFSPVKRYPRYGVIDQN